MYFITIARAFVIAFFNSDINCSFTCIFLACQRASNIRISVLKKLSYSSDSKEVTATPETRVQ